MSVVCFLFLICEFIGGILSGSLAIMCDAAHMFSDVAGFLISFISIYISQRNSNFKYSYGYHRAEILGALASIMFIWVLLIWLNYEATQRILHPPEKIDADIMLITAVIGFCCNIINICQLEQHDGPDSDVETSSNEIMSSEESTSEDIENVQRAAASGYTAPNAVSPLIAQRLGDQTDIA